MLQHLKGYTREALRSLKLVAWTKKTTQILIHQKRKETGGETNVSMCNSNVYAHNVAIYSQLQPWHILHYNWICQVLILWLLITIYIVVLRYTIMWTHNVTMFIFTCFQILIKLRHQQNVSLYMSCERRACIAGECRCVLTKVCPSCLDGLAN